MTTIQYTLRDPRRDPKPGDVFRKQSAIVSIDRSDKCSFIFRANGWCDDMALLLPCWNEPWLPLFRQWAKGAEVLHVAEGAGGGD